MKRIAYILLLLAFCLVGCTAREGKKTGASLGEAQSVSIAPTDRVEYVAKTPKNLKAVWLSQWDMQRVYLDRGKQREETDFRIRAERIMEDAKTDGFNTIFLQVRPFGDSFYPSEWYPPSKMTVGSYGEEFVYDPVKILVEAAHSAELSIHAWINPLRLMTTEELESVPDVYPVKQWYMDASLRGKYLVLQGDGRWYLNPGYDEVRALIVSGATEIMREYEFDGLHMDDYFYPTTSQDFDGECFAEYVLAGGEMTLSDFRRECISRLASELYKTVHEQREGALFGIAPGGNPDRTYGSQYADVYRWGREAGFVDYICPEIYFGFEHESYPFEETARRWQSMVQCPEVRLYVGLSFHKASAGYDQYAGSGAYEWAENSDILLRSLECVSKMEGYSGAAVFSYQHFRNALTGQVPEYPKLERDAFLPLWKTVVFAGAR